MMLKTYDICSPMFVGAATNLYVEPSLRDVGQPQYLPIIVSHAVAASPPERQETSLANIKEIFGRVNSSDKLLKQSASRDSRFRFGPHLCEHMEM